MIDPRDSEQLARADSADEDLFRLAIELDGSIPGEHGILIVKDGHLRRQWPPGAARLHEEIKRAFDPKGLMSPGKKRA